VDGPVIVGGASWAFCWKLRQCRCRSSCLTESGWRSRLDKASARWACVARTTLGLGRPSGGGATPPCGWVEGQTREVAGQSTGEVDGVGEDWRSGAAAGGGGDCSGPRSNMWCCALTRSFSPYELLPSRLRKRDDAGY
jgi:hypothetical protein